jgi:hypothetical protein
MIGLYGSYSVTALIIPSFPLRWCVWKSVPFIHGVWIFWAAHEGSKGLLSCVWLSRVFNDYLQAMFAFWPSHPLGSSQINMTEVRRCGNIINNSFVVNHMELACVETLI